jgi:hypothetical protein
MTVNEDDGTIEIQVELSKAASEDITIEYTLDGSAIDLISAGNQYNPDYEILGDYLEFEIAKGETTGIIEIQLYSDFQLEDPETIEIEIQDVDGGNVEITNDDDITITIEQEDGMAIVLDWPDPVGDQNADMDLVLRIGETTAALDDIVAVSANGSFLPIEYVFIPLAVQDAAFGVSYNYYEGTLDPLEFEAIFIDITDGILEPENQRVTYQGTYTAANINEWTDITSTLVVQTFEINSGVFGNFTQIIPAGSGSRISQGPGVRKLENGGSVYYQTFDSFARTPLK